MVAQRTIIFGDVHGCHHELDRLCDEIKPDPSVDRIYFIGDLINKGPSSKKCFKRFRKLGARSILGNHELALLRHLDNDNLKKGIVRNMRQEFRRKFPDLVAELKTWPPYIEEDDFLLVHAGLLPDRSLSEMDPWDLVNIRTWDGEGKDLQNPANPPWFDFYKGDKLVVFGHWAALGGIERDNVIGLDTGCVYGGSLSVLILPERRIVKVAARRPYCEID